MEPMRWTVGCHLGIEVVAETTVVLQIAPVATDGRQIDEVLDVQVDGRPLPVRRIDGDHGGVAHVVTSPPGNLTVDLRSTVVEATPAPGVEPDRELSHEQLTYLRQSRYCPSDTFNGFAAYELGHLAPGAELLDAVGAWVASRLTYESGSSGPLDSAVESLFAGRGVCRDFAHLAITVLRALDVPARLVAVYAPGLSPMDFHAVVEAHVDGRWCVLDPTRLAPRPSLLRIATGRDAADTAFLTVLGGEATLVATEVVASTDGVLPDDDHTGLRSMPPVG